MRLCACAVSPAAQTLSPSRDSCSVLADFSSAMALVVHYVSLASPEGSVQLRYGCIPQLAPGGIFAPAGGVRARMGGMG
jgi:hypothetical protein